MRHAHGSSLSCASMLDVAIFSFLTLVVVNLAGLALSTLVIALLVGAWGPLSAKAASIAATFARNYLFSARVVFRQ